MTTHTFKEEEYSIPKGIISHENYVIISGCSGGGKSALIRELGKRNYDSIPEPGRQIVKEQLSIDGDGLPWENPEKFIDLVLSRYIYTFQTMKPTSRLVFFDRGIPDAIYAAPGKEIPSYQVNAARKFRYHKKVFMTPPWEEIFKNDEERRHSFKDSLLSYASLVKTYRDYGYEVLEVPKVSVEARADFILSYL